MPVPVAGGLVEAWLNGSAGRNPGWLNGQVWDGLSNVRGPVLVELIKPVFPEVTVDMPREWLLKLVGNSGKIR